MSAGFVWIVLSRKCAAEKSMRETGPVRSLTVGFMMVRAGMIRSVGERAGNRRF